MTDLTAIWKELIDLTLLRGRVVEGNDLIGRLFKPLLKDETPIPTWDELERAKAALEKKVPGFYVWYLKEENAYCLFPDTSKEPAREKQEERKLASASTCRDCTSAGAYVCCECNAPLCYGHMIAFDGLEYCTTCAPGYDKHQQF